MFVTINEVLRDFNKFIYIYIHIYIYMFIFIHTYNRSFSCIYIYINMYTFLNKYKYIYITKTIKRTSILSKHVVESIFVIVYKLRLLT